MATQFLSVTAARALGGLRLVGIRGIPSPWAEAAKGIFHVKSLPFVVACQQADEPPTALIDWAGDVGVPVVAYEKEKTRSGWAEILLLAERLAPAQALIPADPTERALMFGLAHEICGEMGLGWCMRLLLIRNALGHGAAAGAGTPSVSPRVASYLAPRYGFDPDSVAQATQRVVDLLTILSGRIAARPYLMGDALTALDIYWATFANLVTPLPEADMQMRADMRVAYTCLDERVLGALSPALRAHQRKVYEQHLRLPVEL